jgi:hypothetical protein
VVVVYQYSCRVHGVFSTSSIRREPEPEPRCAECGAHAETWVGPRIDSRSTGEPSRRDAHRYWSRTGWIDTVFGEGAERAFGSEKRGEPILRASGPHLPEVGPGEQRRRHRRTAVISLLLVAILGGSVLLRIGTSGSDGKGPAARAAAACVDATAAANEFDAGGRSPASTRVVLTEAVQTMRPVTRQYVGYSDIVRSVAAVRDDIAAGLPEPSPQNLDYLNAICGAPPRTVT